MTAREAIERLSEAVNEAIRESEDVGEALTILGEMGIELHAVELSLNMFVAKRPAAKTATEEADAAFLRHLRIDPSLKVKP